ncbi:MAG: hypothetical protein ACYDDO_12905 [Acidiferrobacterales bacterium]
MVWLFLISWLIVAFVVAVVFGHAACRDDISMEMDNLVETPTEEQARPLMH